MRRYTLFIAVLLIAGHLSLEFGELLEKLFPEYAEMRIDPFWDSSYEFPGGQGIPLKWWVYYVSNDFLWVVVMFALTIVSGQYSFRLFRVCFIFFLYHIFDHLLMWYNYRSTHWVYWLMGIFYTAAVISMFFPEKKTAVIKSME